MHSKSDVRRQTSDVSRICGIDEAGRGALAGPLIAAAVILTKPLSLIANRANTPIRDSKTLSQEQRERIYQALIALGVVVDTEGISVDEINTKGIGWANREAMRRLINRSQATQYIADGKLKLGTFPNRNITVVSQVDADATVPAVILAGIVAKVVRDRIMEHIHEEYPQYCWEQNKGYGTARHIQSIEKYHPCHYHRIVFVTTAMRNFLAKKRYTLEYAIV